MPETGKVSAGVIAYRRREEIEVLLVHPGAPMYAGREDGVWSFPKGLVEPGETIEVAARREFAEETGLPLDGVALTLLGSVEKPTGKVVHAFVAERDLGEFEPRSNSFEMEWPRESGERRRFPEVDRAAYFPIGEARDKVSGYMLPALDRLERHLADLA